MKIDRTWWVEFTAEVSKDELHEYVGEKCSTFDADCPVCKQHKLWEETGTMALLVDGDDLVNYAIRGEVS